MMQGIRANVYVKFQIDSNLQHIRCLHRKPAFQTGVAALILLALLSWLHIRPLGIIFLIIFCFWFYKNRSNLSIQMPPELEEHIQRLQRRVVEFREAKPAMFCGIASVCLGVLAVVGHLVSGSTVVLTGLILAAILSSKFNFKIIKIERRDWPETTLHDNELDEEFMPEENETNMFVLERASDLASLTLPTEDGENDEDKSDEIPSELLIPDPIPEIDENSTDEDVDDLLPMVHVSKSETYIKTPNPAADASVKYSQNTDTIEFKKGHFKQDLSLSNTSSSSEESLSKGLHFPDHMEIDGPKKRETSKRPISQEEMDNDLVAMAINSQTQTLLANSSKLIPTLMTGLMQGVLGVGPTTLPPQDDTTSDRQNRRVVVVSDQDYSDESDFEILDDDDFQQATH